MTEQIHQGKRTFKMKENIRLVVLEHLAHELRVHVGEVDFLQVLVKLHHDFVQFFLSTCELSASCEKDWDGIRSICPLRLRDIPRWR
jgi:hypothetical protein